MTTSPSGGVSELRRPDWQWYVLLLLLIAVLSVGALVVIKQEFWALPLAVAMFSIAFAIHYFGVSIGLNGVFIREKDQNKRYQLRQIEYRIVSSGTLVLAGGLLLLFAAGIGILLKTYSWAFIAIYIAGALILLLGIVRYVMCQRGWPREDYSHSVCLYGTR